MIIHFIILILSHLTVTTFKFENGLKQKERSWRASSQELPGPTLH